MTGWRSDEAVARPLEEVLHILNGATRIPVRNPLMLAITDNRVSRLTEGCILVRRDGSEAGIEDSAAPIHDRNGQVTGAVMVFHDVTQARALALSERRILHQHDALSGLANKVLLNDRLSHAISAAGAPPKASSPCCLSMSTDLSRSTTPRAMPLATAAATGRGTAAACLRAQLRHCRPIWRR